MREDIYVSLSKLKDLEISDKELIILLAINGLIVGNLAENCINYSVLGYAVFGRKVNQTERETLKKYFNKLIDKDIIKLVEPIDKSTILCNVEQVFVNVQQNNDKKEFYVHITKTELHKMMNVSDKIDNYKLVRLYLWYINSLHKGDLVEEKYKNKIGFMPQSYLSSVTGINIKTLYKYDDILQEQELLYIARHKIEVNASTGVSGMTNTYSRYEDKALCDDYAVNIKNRYYSEKDLDLKRFKQSYSQKFHQFHLGKTYSLEELLKIDKYVGIYNAEIEKGIRKGDKLDNSFLKEEINKLSLQEQNDGEYSNHISHYLVNNQTNLSLKYNIHESNYENNYSKSTNSTYKNDNDFDKEVLDEIFDEIDIFTYEDCTDEEPISLQLTYDDFDEDYSDEYL